LAYVVPVVWAMRFAAEGVKFAVVERWTLYRATPTLSVAADHERLTEAVPTFAERSPGAVGG
jgi:hypothetical protein